MRCSHKSEQEISKSAWSVYRFGENTRPPKHSLGFRSDKDQPDPVTQKEEQAPLWPDPKFCSHHGQDLADLLPWTGTGHGRSARGSSKPPPDTFQIQISQPSGCTIMQWVSSSDLVLDLKLKLESRMGILAGIQRLLFQGKQLEDPVPLSAYSILRNSSVVTAFRLSAFFIQRSCSL